jgi:tetratricopeptide (TPR) repeat protein
MICPAVSRTFASGVILLTLTAGGMTGGRAETPEPEAAKNPEAAKSAVRSGNHADYGRIVIETNGKTAYQLDQDGDHVVVRLNGDVTLGSPPAAPRNVVTITTDGSTIELILKHGTTLNPKRLDGRVVLDVLDRPDNANPPANGHDFRKHPPLAMASSPELGGRTANDPATPPAMPTAERAPVSAQELPSVPATPSANGSSAPARPDPASIEAAQQMPPGRDVLPENAGPVDLVARRVKLPKEMDGSGFLIPFNSTTGAASFRSGDSTYVVFDERRPVDMSALRSDPAFSAASVRLLPGGTLFRIPLPQNRSVMLTQMPQGWRLVVLTTVLKQQPIIVSVADGHLNLAAEQTSDVVSLADPDTGATLLVGTQHHAGQGVPSGRQSTEFILRPTFQGVVLEPLSDNVVLKQVSTGFTLAGGPSGLAVSPSTPGTEGLMNAALLTTRFAFSNIPADALRQRVVNQVGDAAMSPPLARGRKNHEVAESLMALGLEAEAESVMLMATEQDPKEAASPDTGALIAIAALLAGRPEEANALADPRLDGSDEILLWRAIRQAMLDDGSPGAAAVFAATAQLVFQYPPPIRDHILPLIAETMIKGGEVASAAHLLGQRADDPKLAYARALMLQAEGDTDGALGLLDALTNGHDQFDRARAAIRAVELRLATRKLDKIQAADALDKLLYAWRGDARELALRERIADLRGQAGAWRVALAALRQAETDFPEQAVPVHGRLKDMFTGMIRSQDQQQMPPIEFVSMVDENADLMAGSAEDDAVQQSLADRLLALDLPGRARPVLEKLMRSASSDLAKARFGMSLATLESREGDDAGARAVLEASEGRDLPSDLVEKRVILRAGSLARLGDPVAAAALLMPLRTGRAIEARAQILELASDWAGAEQAWSDCVALTQPESGVLDETQTRTLLRLATATARASDDAGLADLRVKYGTRIGASPLGDMFRLLTAEPIRTTSDIKRSQREVTLAASLPAGLKALQPGSVAR